MSPSHGTLIMRCDITSRNGALSLSVTSGFCLRVVSKEIIHLISNVTTLSDVVIATSIFISDLE